MATFNMQSFANISLFYILAVLNFAGFDPMFMFHHSQVDRLWAVMQKKVDENGTTAWTPQSALEALEPASDFGYSNIVLRFEYVILVLI